MSDHIFAGKRASGVLMHITSLPGRYGIGDLGEAAYRFADCLAATGQSFWQVLPLGPTGFADSPYASFSAFAGNPLLISLDKLSTERGWLTPEELAAHSSFEKTDASGAVRLVDFDGDLIRWHNAMLAHAYGRFLAVGKPEEHRALAQFRLEHADWLEDFALYTAIKAAQGQRSWREWPDGLRLRAWSALAEARTAFQRQIEEIVFQQWVFREQWDALKRYVNARGVLLIGDIPFYVAEDSSDVWANRLLFDLNSDGRPNTVAGVPPDFFSDAGQLWGNPLYDWPMHRRTNYRWWMERIAATLRTVDALRIDHFRAFYNYWRVVADDVYWNTPLDGRTAKNGDWVYWGTNRERDEFFQTHVPPGDKARLIAENLGADMCAVDSWLDGRLNLPGMQVLQFAFGDDKATESRFWPERFNGHNHKFAVMYPGTHDNNTTCGWWRQDAGDTHKRQVRALIQDWNLQVNADAEPNWALAELAMHSNTRVVILPMQDVLGLDERARMNKPQHLGWWRWRCFEADLPLDSASGRWNTDAPGYGAWMRLKALTEASGRR